MLIIKLKPSTQLALLFGTLHCIGIICIIIININFYLKTVTTIIITASFVYQLYHYALLKASQSITTITLQNNSWSLITKRRDILPVTLKGKLFLTNRLILFNFKTIGSKRTIKVILCKDGIMHDSQEILRRLKMYFFSYKNTT